MNPAAAPFFFAAFEAIPQTGSMTVPVQLHPLTNVTEARELSPQTAGPFMRTLGTALSEINTLFLPGLMNVPLPGGWTAFSSGSKHLVLENHREGKSLRFDRGGRLTEQLTGHATGLALAVRRYGLFTSVDMAQGISLKQDLLWIPHFYELRFEAFGVAALKEYLGLSRETPLLETGLALFGSLGIDGGPLVMDIPEEDGPWNDPFPDAEMSGTLKEGRTQVNLRTGLDAASLAMGQLCETLALEVYPTDPGDQRLPAPLLSLWNSAETLAERYRAEDDSTEALSKAYFRSTRRIYAGALISPGPEDIN
jgi:hypothetical protein